MSVETTYVPMYRIQCDFCDLGPADVVPDLARAKERAKDLDISECLVFAHEMAEPTTHWCCEGCKKTFFRVQPADSDRASAFQRPHRPTAVGLMRSGVDPLQRSEAST
ncbi:MAG TPA: hypothetical protein VKA46_04300 [Gemmataceae bacterium]|nr:hypothetical protein [Gemmataceae bacterium]